MSAFDVVWFSMQSHPVRFYWITIVLAVGACAPRQPKLEPWISGDPAAPSQITPTEALSLARDFATHPWQPYSRNILHGKDKAGVVVHTPDMGHEPQQARKGWWIPGVVNEGIPYKWGGFDDLKSFDAAIDQGFAAGDVSSPAKRAADNAAVSPYAAGLDCSGFVSRCLKLPRVHDTTQLPSICEKLPDAKNLRPGDLLNIQRGHVVLCAGWGDPEKTWIYYYETGGGPQYWKPALKKAPLHAMLALGYQPLRYRGMAHAALAEGESAKEVLTRSIQSQAIIVPSPTVGEP